jgi:hypothetical protein
MWPFSIIHRRRRERAFKAAVLVLLGTYFYDGLRAEEKARVEAEVADMFTGHDIGTHGWYASSWLAAGAFRSLAMSHLGIGPITGISWAEILAPWKYCSLEDFGLPDKDARAVFIVDDYRPMDSATEEARTFLRAKGLDIPEVGPWSLPRTDGGKPMGPGEHPGWRKSGGV